MKSAATAAEGSGSAETHQGGGAGSRHADVGLIQGGAVLERHIADAAEVKVAADATEGEDDGVLDQGLGAGDGCVAGGQVVTHGGDAVLEAVGSGGALQVVAGEEVAGAEKSETGGSDAICRGSGRAAEATHVAPFAADDVAGVSGAEGDGGAASNDRADAAEREGGAGDIKENAGEDINGNQNIVHGDVGERDLKVGANYIKGGLGRTSANGGGKGLARHRGGRNRGRNESATRSAGKNRTLHLSIPLNTQHTHIPWHSRVAEPGGTCHPLSPTEHMYLTFVIRRGLQNAAYFARKHHTRTLRDIRLSCAYGTM